MAAQVSTDVAVGDEKLTAAIAIEEEVQTSLDKADAVAAATVTNSDIDSAKLVKDREQLEKKLTAATTVEEK